MANRRAKADDRIISKPNKLQGQIPKKVSRVKNGKIAKLKNNAVSTAEKRRKNSAKSKIEQIKSQNGNRGITATRKDRKSKNSELNNNQKNLSKILLKDSKKTSNSKPKNLKRNKSVIKVKLPISNFISTTLQKHTQSDSKNRARSVAINSSNVTKKLQPKNKNFKELVKDKNRKVIKTEAEEKSLGTKQTISNAAPSKIQSKARQANNMVSNSGKNLKQSLQNETNAKCKITIEPLCGVSNNFASKYNEETSDVNTKNIVHSSIANNAVGNKIPKLSKAKCIVKINKNQLPSTVVGQLLKKKYSANMDNLSSKETSDEDVKAATTSGTSDGRNCGTEKDSTSYLANSGVHKHEGFDSNYKSSSSSKYSQHKNQLDELDAEYSVDEDALDEVGVLQSVKKKRKIEYYSKKANKEKKGMLCTTIDETIEDVIKKYSEPQEKRYKKESNVDHRPMVIFENVRMIPDTEYVTNSDKTIRKYCSDENKRKMKNNTIMENVGEKTSIKRPVVFLENMFLNNDLVQIYNLTKYLKGCKSKEDDASTNVTNINSTLSSSLSTSPNTIISFKPSSIQESPSSVNSLKPSTIEENVSASPTIVKSLKSSTIREKVSPSPAIVKSLKSSTIREKVCTSSSTANSLKPITIEENVFAPPTIVKSLKSSTIREKVSASPSTANSLKPSTIEENVFAPPTIVKSLKSSTIREKVSASPSTANSLKPSTIEENVFAPPTIVKSLKSSTIREKVSASPSTANSLKPSTIEENVFAPPTIVKSLKSTTIREKVSASPSTANSLKPITTEENVPAPPTIVKSLKSSTIREKVSASPSTANSLKPITIEENVSAPPTIVKSLKSSTIREKVSASPSTANSLKPNPMQEKVSASPDTVKSLKSRAIKEKASTSCGVSNETNNSSSGITSIRITRTIGASNTIVTCVPLPNENVPVNKVCDSVDSPLQSLPLLAENNSADLQLQSSPLSSVNNSADLQWQSLSLSPVNNSTDLPLQRIPLSPASFSDDLSSQSLPLSPVNSSDNLFLQSLPPSPLNSSSALYPICGYAWEELYRFSTNDKININSLEKIFENAKFNFKWDRDISKEERISSPIPIKKPVMPIIVRTVDNNYARNKSTTSQITNQESCIGTKSDGVEQLQGAKKPSPVNNIEEHHQSVTDETDSSSDSSEQLHYKKKPSTANNDEEHHQSVTDETDNSSDSSEQLHYGKKSSTSNNNEEHLQSVAEETNSIQTLVDSMPNQQIANSDLPHQKNSNNSTTAAGDSNISGFKNFTQTPPLRNLTFKIPLLPPAKRPPRRAKFVSERDLVKNESSPLSNVQNRVSSCIENDDILSITASSISCMTNLEEEPAVDNVDVQDNSHNIEIATPTVYSELEDQHSSTKSFDNRETEDLQNNVTNWMVKSQLTKMQTSIEISSIPRVFKKLCYYYFSNDMECTRRYCNNWHQIEMPLRNAINNLSYEELVHAYMYASHKDKLYRATFYLFVSAFERLKCTSDLVKFVEDILRSDIYNKTPFIEQIVSSLCNIGIPFIDAIEEILVIGGGTKIISFLDILLDIVCLSNKKTICSNWCIVQNLIKHRTEPIDRGLIEEIMTMCFEDNNIELAINIVRDIIRPGLGNLNTIDILKANNFLQFLLVQEVKEGQELLEIMTSGGLLIISPLSNGVSGFVSDNVTTVRKSSSCPSTSAQSNDKKVSHSTFHSDKSLDYEDYENDNNFSKNSKSSISSSSRSSIDKNVTNNFPSNYGGESEIRCDEHYTPQNTDPPSPAFSEICNEESQHSIRSDENVICNPNSHAHDEGSSHSQNILSHDVASNRSRSITSIESSTRSQRTESLGGRRPDNLESHGLDFSFNDDANLSPSNSMHGIPLYSLDGEELPEDDLRLLKDIIDRRNNMELYLMINKFKDPTKNKAFILNALVCLKTKMPEEIYEMFFSIIKAVEQMNLGDHDVQNTLNTLVVNVLGFFEHHQSYAKGSSILLQFHGKYKDLQNCAWFMGPHRYLYSELGKYIYFCKILVKGRQIKEAWEILTLPGLKLLYGVNKWTMKHCDCFDNKLRNFVLEDLINAALDIDIGFAKIVILSIIKDNNIITEIDIWKHFNHLLLKMIDKSEFMKDLKIMIESINEGWYKNVYQSVMRGLLVSLLREIPENDALALYDKCCKRKCYPYIRGDERTLYLSTNMVEPEIYMTLHVYLYKKVRNNFPLHSLIIVARLPDPSHQQPQILTNSNTNIQDLKSKVCSVLAKSLRHTICVDYSNTGEQHIVVEANQLQPTFNYYRKLQEQSVK